MASVEDATPAKAEAAVQIWPGPLPATVTHFPAGLYLEGSGRTPPGTPDVYCDAASLLLRAPRLLRLTLVVAIVLYACGCAALGYSSERNLGRCAEAMHPRLRHAH